MHTHSATKPVVLIFKETLLPVSETFIEDQARHLTSFQSRYIGLGRVSPSLPIPADAIVLAPGTSFRSELAQKTYRRTGIANKFHREAEKINAQLIHAHFASGGRSALPLARHLGIPLVVTLHGSDVTRRIDFRKRYRRLWDEASRFICVSDFIKRKAEDAGFPRKKLVTLYIGIDTYDFRPRLQAREKDLVVFVGRLVEKKGCAFLLRAMAEVKKTRPTARVVVIGDGPLRASLQSLAERLNILVPFLGSQPKPVIEEWLSKARLFCAPSITASDGDSEGLGMVFAEAQAMGTPVVSSAHGGVPEVVVHGRTGLLAPEGDVSTLASHISRFLEDDAFWMSCSEEGIAWIRSRFDLKSQIRHLEQLYVDVCNSNHRPGSMQLLETGVLQIAAGNA